MPMYSHAVLLGRIECTADRQEKHFLLLFNVGHTTGSFSPCFWLLKTPCRPKGWFCGQ